LPHQSSKKERRAIRAITCLGRPIEPKPATEQQPNDRAHARRQDIVRDSHADDQADHEPRDRAHADR
jgi:hypothetical protein